MLQSGRVRVNGETEKDAKRVIADDEAVDVAPKRCSARCRQGWPSCTRTRRHRHPQVTRTAHRGHGARARDDGAGLPERIPEAEAARIASTSSIASTARPRACSSSPRTSRRARAEGAVRGAQRRADLRRHRRRDDRPAAGHDPVAPHRAPRPEDGQASPQPRATPSTPSRTTAPSPSTAATRCWR